MSISYFWSKTFLSKNNFLWLLFICNLLGTVYGYIWYGGQMEYTLEHYSSWIVVFVPDSPTASLFFTVAVGCLLFPPRTTWGKNARYIIEALAVVTSVKYGIWASSIIFAGQYQGDILQWQDWMLVVSHSAMVVESLLYVRFFKFNSRILLGAAAWTLLNDFIDYTYGVYPWLPNVLGDNITEVQNFTIVLTIFSVVVTWITLKYTRVHKHVIK
ncbi:DUF1405 domain-containing protein [Paenibacillus crassostreae]|uniref:DUF1405 domain-containing protein n=1 Tax=Paenibacillus crassostreae TaxID=1763538 RepID=A0A162RST3_9BACL|nr:DUF1405 domain-containing protein [Paenibacillus crassostreae]AOZ91324.1 hypothetical protein LPB68_03310 [Paenibacillus crassostreae]OAB74517.1 hypothetical protein PNBC_10650 [Paenibacillus crassostreae]